KDSAFLCRRSIGNPAWTHAPRARHASAFRVQWGKRTALPLLCQRAPFRDNHARQEIASKGEQTQGPGMDQAVRKEELLPRHKLPRGRVGVSYILLYVITSSSSCLYQNAACALAF